MATPLGINNGNSRWAREYNGRNGGVSVARPRTMREELNTAYTAAMMKARGVRGSRKPSDVAMYKAAEKQMADLSEQLTLLDACEMEFIKPDFAARLNWIADMTPDEEAGFNKLFLAGALK